jgi:hypothetical protein
MSQLDHLVTVYGLIDDAVVENPDLLPRVAAMLPPYRVEGCAGWYRSLQDWQEETGVQLVAPDALERRGFASALTGLAEPLVDADFEAQAQTDVEVDQRWATQHWLDGRSTLASATLGRIEGDLNLSDDEDPALLLNGIALDDLSAQRFHSDMRRVGDYQDIDSWSTMMDRAVVRNQFTASYQDSTLAPRVAPSLLQPITSYPDAFRVVPSPTMGTSVAFRTHHHLPDLSLDDAERCLIPEDWDKYNPPWCEMRPMADPGCYLEVISADCSDPAHGRLETILEFQKRGLPDGGQILGYRIPDGSATGLVTIDEGSLEVRPARPPEVGIHFVTTKRIQFRPLRRMPTPTAAAIGFLVWVLGWDSMAERFIYFLARNPTTATRGPVSASPMGPSSDGGVATVLDLSVSGLQTYVKECVDSVTCSMRRAAAGDYGLTDYLSDLTKVSKKVTSNTTALAAMAASMCETAPGSPPAPPGATGTATTTASAPTTKEKTAPTTKTTTTEKTSPTKKRSTMKGGGKK